MQHDRAAGSPGDCAFSPSAIRPLYAAVNRGRSQGIRRSVLVVALLVRGAIDPIAIPIGIPAFRRSLAPRRGQIDTF